MTESPVTTFVMRRLIEEMQTHDLTIRVYRDRRRGHLRYFLSNGKRIHRQTVQVMQDRGLLEQIEPAKEANEKNEVHYRLKVNP